MASLLKKFACTARIFILRYRVRSKLVDLHALSVQQMSDLYLGDAILGEIRTLQRELDACIEGTELLHPKSSPGADETG
jgi:hypothetical protein